MSNKVLICRTDGMEVTWSLWFLTICAWGGCGTLYNRVNDALSF